MNHLLSIEQLGATDIADILKLSGEFKTARGKPSSPTPLTGQTWALIFNKPSTRTRVSFEVGIRELGGSPLYLSINDIQMGRGESVADTAGVLSRFIHGVVIRTFAQRDVEEFAQHGTIPVINALTDEEHPCQILADLFTIREKRGALDGCKIVFIGDGACNVAYSWIFAAAKTGIDLWIAAPGQFQPDPAIIRRAGGNVHVTDALAAAARGADVLYTDVWVSMGKEEESADRLSVLAPYQIDDALVALARPGALVMHCLPAYREKEISSSVFAAHQQTIFDQAENRLHAQKAVMARLAARRPQPTRPSTPRDSTP
jgi:ornithine carbamoyltransferase